MGKTLVSVAYYETPESLFNMMYFLQYGIMSGHDFIIVVNGDSTVKFPSNVRVLYRPNKGYDFGAHKAAIESVHSLDDYAFFIFLNSSVIGPILPDHLRDIDWIAFFKQKFDKAQIGLLGTTIVCLPPTDAGGFGPKVEGFFWCTDRVGLDLIVHEGTILYEHDTKYAAIVEGEYGLSRCMLRHDRNIGCMLRRYEGIDWREKVHWHYNGYQHPSRAGSFFGSSIDPYEVIFHKWYWAGLPTVNYDIILKHVEKMNTDSSEK